MHGSTGGAGDCSAAKRATYAETAKAEWRGQGEPVRDTLRRSVRIRRRRQQPDRVPRAAARGRAAGPGAAQRAQRRRNHRLRGRLPALCRRQRHADLLRRRQARPPTSRCPSCGPAGRSRHRGGGRHQRQEPRRRSGLQPVDRVDAGAGRRRRRARQHRRGGPAPAYAGGADPDLGAGHRAAAARATEQIQASVGIDPHAAADATWAASDFLSARPAGSSRAGAVGC
jgi:hypothetical protein